MTRFNGPNNKVLVIGFDGVSWDLLEPYFKKNKLPNLKSLTAKGCKGKLKSTIPPITGPAWVSFATGKNPGKHGCFSFLFPSENLNDLDYISRDEIKSETFYEFLEKEGKDCILINLPCSFPPRISGIVISSFLNPSGITYSPHYLKKQIPELKDYKVAPDYSKALKNSSDYLHEILQIEKIRFKVAQKLFTRKWDFFFILFSAPDWIQHRWSRDFASAEKDQAIFSILKDLDNYVGWFVKNLPKNCNLILMSDHGFKTYKGEFNINKWLEKNGFLETGLLWQGNRRPHNLIEMTILDRKDKKFHLFIIKKIAGFLINHPKIHAFFGIILRLLSKLFPNLIPPEFDSIGFGANLKKTKAYSPPASFAVYLNSKKRFRNGTLNKEEYQRSLTQIIRKLSKEKSIVKKIFKKNQIYSGENLVSAPDILFELEDFWISLSLFSKKEVSFNKLDHHSQYGILAATGPDIKNIDKMIEADICDLAPTILSLMNYSIPKDMDGRILREVIK